MDKTIEGALIGFLGTVVLGLLGFLGVLWKANKDFRLGLITERNKADAQHGTEDSALRDDQRELIASLKVGATDWTTLVNSYVESARQNAALTTKISELESRLSKLEDRIALHDGEKQVWDGEREDWAQERCGLENEVLDGRGWILLLEKDNARLRQEAEHLRILGETSARAQEFAEGATAQANRTIEALANAAPREVEPSRGAETPQGSGR